MIIDTTGALGLHLASDRVLRLRLVSSIVSVWILADGIWDDGGSWFDTAAWID